ncbi:hypothetical protein DFP73DRAFT_108429 [Morchella snyderi]|nr:hypothetical protein DFP73DRAFT_108429 [Morchella snyderi]
MYFYPLRCYGAAKCVSEKAQCEQGEAKCLFGEPTCIFGEPACPFGDFLSDELGLRIGVPGSVFPSEVSYTDPNPDCLLDRALFSGLGGPFVMRDFGVSGLLSPYFRSSMSCSFDSQRSHIDKPKYDINQPTSDMCLGDFECLMNIVYFYDGYISRDRSMYSLPSWPDYSNKGFFPPEGTPNLSEPDLFEWAKNVRRNVQAPPTEDLKNTDRSDVGPADSPTEKLPPVSHPENSGLSGIEILKMLVITLLWFYMIFRIFRSTVGAQVVRQSKVKLR